MASSTVLATISAGIAKQEGFGVTQLNGIPSRPTRNNNPGDIKSTPQSNPGGQFQTDAQNHIIYPSVDLGKAALMSQVNLMLTPGANSHFNPDMTIAEVGKLYATDPNWGIGVASAIDGGKGVINANTKMKDVEAYINNGTVPPITQLPNAAANGGNKDVDLGNADATATDFAGLNLDVTDVQANSLFKDLYPGLVVKTGLDVMPWYRDQGLITGNPRIRKFVAPVTFKMLVGGGVLSSEGLSGTPIEVQLNASVKSFSKTSKHVFNKTNTRTGIHITFWGMQADIIEAQCTTGVFMNQLGLTDFFSTAVANSSDLVKLLDDGFKHTQNFENVSGVDVTQGVIQQKTYGGNSAFRVAAQDAFVEFLSLFKNNGNVYFRSDNSTGLLSGNDQAGISAWSPQTGLSSQQGNARNNDVMTRGSIAMSLKNNTYLGYFKSLSWTQDANSPFQWNFSFVFQVERTITLLEYPRIT